MAVVCFVGAGSVKFTRDLVGNILQYPELTSVVIRLHDVDRGRLETARRVVESVARQLGISAMVTSHIDRREALDGADFVINTVLIGGVTANAADLAVAERFGVRQTVGDTLGVGGIFRAVRTFPFLQSLANDMMELCPAAYLLNYTNPMAMNVGFLAAVAPALKVFGLCHSVQGTVTYLCGVLGVPEDEVAWSSAGVNHQAWILSMERSGESLYPLLDERIRADAELASTVRADMYRRFGYFPTESSKHNSEYLPWYLSHADEVVRRGLPSAADRMRMDENDVAAFDDLSRRLVAGGEVDIPSSVIEFAPQIIHSVVTGRQRRVQVNVPNTGLITNLPAGAPVEVTASVDGSGLHTWYMGALPVQCAALNRSYLNVVELAVHAALTQDGKALRQAAILDPNTAATLTTDEIWELCDALADVHGDLVPAWARQG